MPGHPVAVEFVSILVIVGPVSCFSVRRSPIERVILEFPTVSSGDA
jgi:hypothetical protein